ncbi:MAG: DNA repair protein RadA [Campylobacteraceae bacterium]|nr:DNA repair protein RadA [Campylobacteraceae bacterium]
MAKKKTSLFECQHCGYQLSKWMGKCPDCGGWDSFIELNQEQQEVIKKTSKVRTTSSKATPITEVKQDDIIRFSTYNEEFDLVLGGGVVPGSLILIGGSPGVGKSTLLLKVAGSIAASGKKVLYVSGEESMGQIKLRANRLDANHKNLFLLPEIKLEEIQDELLRENYEVVIIDSIQTMYSANLTSSPGSVTQVREITFELMRKAKETNISIFIIGHITKEGSIAGPRVLEHMVDTVLYFEGEASKELRMLRAFKNRFGSTSEIGIFEMTNEGLISAKDIASKFFDKSKAQAGSALTVAMEGTRALILEVQALVSESNFPNPKRSSTGFDLSRLNMLLALLEKKLELPLNDYDVFINISGGIKIKESSADLAVIAAIISSFRDRPISKESVFIGEVSLTGEIKEVFSMDLRLKEAQAQGVKKAIIAKKPNIKLKLQVYDVDEVQKMIELF